MPRRIRLVAIAAILSTTMSAPLPAGTAAGQPDPMITAATDAAVYMRTMFEAAAGQMNEEDYAFKPTPDVRTFGQLLAHVADANYLFCAAARGEVRAVRSLEDTLATRADIQRALAESFAYCAGAYAELNDARAKTMVQFMGAERPVLAVLMFRTHHAALHYGNVVTYMRLRGKVPPSSQQAPTE